MCLQLWASRWVSWTRKSGAKVGRSHAWEYLMIRQMECKQCTSTRAKNNACRRGTIGHGVGQDPGPRKPIPGVTAYGTAFHDPKFGRVIRTNPINGTRNFFFMLQVTANDKQLRHGGSLGEHSITVTGHNPCQWTVVEILVQYNIKYSTVLIWYFDIIYILEYRCSPESM